MPYHPGGFLVSGAVDMVVMLRLLKRLAT